MSAVNAHPKQEHVAETIYQTASDPSLTRAPTLEQRSHTLLDSGREDTLRIPGDTSEGVLSGGNHDSVYAAGRYNPYKKVSGNDIQMGSYSRLCGRDTSALYSVDTAEESLLKASVLSAQRLDDEVLDHGMRLDSGSKPPVGSEEWHRQRRSNHKEVERRRRETINESISELARIVPGCEKNKGKILERTVTYIQQLKENEASNIEKWTLEKLLTDQAISELSATNQKLKAECDRLWREMNVWKQAAACGINKQEDKDGKKDDPISNVRAEKMD